jgi:DNA-binding response OmpR family regulator
MRILVVEDETKMADYLRKALTESGYAVEIALDGLDGQHLAQESEFDLIILDVMLPGLDGWQLLQIIRRKWQTPVLFLTARDSVDDRVKGLGWGPMIIWSNPFPMPSCWHAYALCYAVARLARLSILWLAT